MSSFEAVLRRDRAVVGVGLAVLTLLAWSYLWLGAGTGMSARETTSIALFPHTQAEPMAGMVMPAAGWATTAAMWWVMMIAMMTPSAAPLVLLYGRVLRHAAGRPSAGAAYVPSTFLMAGYLLAWLVFSIVAATLQYALQRAGLISSMMLWSKSALLSGAVLIAAGAYQLSPLKHACLRHCRNPAEFLTRHWRPGRLGALVLGARHGAWCVGCCSLLMALLFVGGVMNVVWIALLALLVLAEKVAAAGPAVGRVAGIVLIVWGVATLAV